MCVQPHNPKQTAVSLAWQHLNAAADQLATLAAQTRHEGNAAFAEIIIDGQIALLADLVHNVEMIGFSQEVTA